MFAVGSVSNLRCLLSNLTFLPICLYLSNSLNSNLVLLIAVPLVARNGKSAFAGQYFRICIAHLLSFGVVVLVELSSCVIQFGGGLSWATQQRLFAILILNMGLFAWRQTPLHLATCVSKVRQIQFIYNQILVNPVWLLGKLSWVFSHFLCSWIDFFFKSRLFLDIQKLFLNLLCQLYLFDLSAWN